MKNRSIEKKLAKSNKWSFKFLIACITVSITSFKKQDENFLQKHTKKTQLLNYFELSATIFAHYFNQNSSKTSQIPLIC